MAEKEFVVHGKWIEDESYYCCSKCGSAVEEKTPKMPAECPWCGAKMGGEETDARKDD